MKSISTIDFLSLCTLLSLLVVSQSCEKLNEVGPPPSIPCEDCIEITTSTVWENIHDDPDMVDVFIDKDVEVEASLRIEPGAVIAVAEGKKITVLEDGNILATGSIDAPIVFRGEEEEPDFWEGILIQSSTNTFQHCQVLHAGANTGIALHVLSASCLFCGGYTGGINFINSYIGLTSGYGIVCKDSGRLNGFSNNIIEVEGSAAIRGGLQVVDQLDTLSILNSSTGVGMEVLKHAINQVPHITFRGLRNGRTYRILENIETRDATFTPGAILQFEPETMLSIGGTVRAIGTEEAPVVLTSSGTEGWIGLNVQTTDDRNELRYCEITNAGASRFPNITDKNIFANLLIDNLKNNGAPEVKLRHCTISNSGGCAVSVEAWTGIDEQYNVFEDNAGDDICYH